MVHHFLDSGLGIRPFLDLWLLRNKTQFNEKIVQQMCMESGIETFYEACCDLANVWLENAEHNETTEMLEMFCVSGGVYGSRKFKYALRLRERRGWLYLFSRVLPPKDQVKRFYQNGSENDHTLGYYYFVRLRSWFRENRRMSLKEQISDILSMNPEYLDLSIDLFKRLGL